MLNLYEGNDLIENMFNTDMLCNVLCTDGESVASDKTPAEVPVRQ